MTARPLRSDAVDPPVGDPLARELVLVSLMCILSTGTPKARLATW